jgi:hypothetical protein
MRYRINRMDHQEYVMDNAVSQYGNVLGGSVSSPNSLDGNDTITSNNGQNPSSYIMTAGERIASSPTLKND